jgi:hypothetical protein
MLAPPEQVEAELPEGEPYAGGVDVGWDDDGED